MQLVSGKVDYTVREPSIVLMFTANACIKRNGELVMGAGNAKALSKAVPGISKAFGDAVGQSPRRHCHMVTHDAQLFMSFRTKENWMNPSNEQLLMQSALELQAWAIRNPGLTFCLPAPGINHGGMDWNTVYGIIQGLPHNVVVYKA